MNVLYPEWSEAESKDLSQAEKDPSAMLGMK